MLKNEVRYNSDKSSYMHRVLERLNSCFKLRDRFERDPFQVLVATVLSQNTNWKNTEKAYNSLIEELPNLEKIYHADLSKIRNLIRPAGLYNNKSRVLKELSRIIQEDYGGDLNQILEKPVKKAREELKSLPGVGPKTADCVLLFAKERDILPVDTHIARISKRMGLAGFEDAPEEIRDKVAPLIPRGRRGEAHVLLIELGRRYCKARNPNHGDCPVKDICPKISIE